MRVGAPGGLSMWEIITRLGDAAIMVPGALAVAAWLAMGRSHRLALCWCAMFGAAVALVALSKIAFVMWGFGVPSLNFRGISGHAMLASAVIPTIAWLVPGPRAVRAGALALGAAALVLVCASRLVLHMHSMSEVGAGLALGLAVSFCTVHLIRRAGAPAGRRGIAWVALMCIAGTAMGGATPSQRWIAHWARLMAPEAAWEPRAHLLHGEAD
jgi:membrane-associated phospholipid phosphatase